MSPVIPFIPLIAAGLTAGGAVASSVIGTKASKANAAAAMQRQTIKLPGAPAGSPLVGEGSAQRGPSAGQRLNAIYTSPQGVLSDAPVGRSSLLGG